MKPTDRVIWSGVWGIGTPTQAQVSHIEICNDGSKYGRSVSEVAWALLSDPLQPRRVIVSLTNGHWAYGYQLCPLDVPNRNVEVRS